MWSTTVQIWLTVALFFVSPQYCLHNITHLDCLKLSDSGLLGLLLPAMVSQTGLLF